MIFELARRGHYQRGQGDRHSRSHHPHNNARDSRKVPGVRGEGNQEGQNAEVNRRRASPAFLEPPGMFIAAQAALSGHPYIIQRFA